MTICAECKAEKTTKGERIPMGWHRANGGAFCSPCWRKRYVLRAVTFPVIGPQDKDWPALRVALADAWADSTAIANWSIIELVKNDTIRRPSDGKCPKMPAIYLYGLAKKTYLRLLLKKISNCRSG